MRVVPIVTDRVSAGQLTLEALVDRWVPDLADGTVVAVASKVVSLCENRVVATNAATKLELVARESDKYLAIANDYGFHFSITRGTLIPAAGIDESNTGGGYLLWPADPQASANALRLHLSSRTGNKVGVIITDSTCTPLRRGTIGVCLSHSGFRATNSYIGKPDLFGRPLKVSVSNVAGGLAAAAVVAMGEGAERSPLCVIDDLPFVAFQSRDPTESELADITIDPDADLFAPFLRAVSWVSGGSRQAAATPTETEDQE